LEILSHEPELKLVQISASWSSETAAKFWEGISVTGSLRAYVEYEGPDEDDGFYLGVKEVRVNLDMYKDVEETDWETAEAHAKPTQSTGTAAAKKTYCTARPDLSKKLLQKLLNSRGFTHIYHANAVETSLSFVSADALLSRADIIRKGLP